MRTQYHYYRIPMRKHKILVLTIFSICMAASSVWACNCKKAGSIQQEFKEHDAIFLGMVLEVKPAGAIRPGYTLVRFRPIKRYKGSGLLPNPDVVTVFTPDNKNGCGMKFNKRIDYLVFAKGNPAFLVVDSCSSSGVQEDKKKELQFLEERYKESVRKK